MSTEVSVGQVIGFGFICQDLRAIAKHIGGGNGWDSLVVGEQTERIRSIVKGVTGTTAVRRWRAEGVLNGNPNLAARVGPLILKAPLGEPPKFGNVEFRMQAYLAHTQPPHVLDIQRNEGVITGYVDILPHPLDSEMVTQFRDFGWVMDNNSRARFEISTQCPAACGINGHINHIAEQTLQNPP